MPLALAGGFFMRGTCGDAATPGRRGNLNPCGVELRGAAADGASQKHLPRRPQPPHTRDARGAR